MDSFIEISIGLVFLVFTIGLYISNKMTLRTQILDMIENYSFPMSLKKTFLESYPYVDSKKYELIISSLKQYLALYCLESRSLFPNTRTIAIPSLLVEKLWNLFSAEKEYTHFCQYIFGKNIVLANIHNKKLCHIEKSYMNAYYRVDDLKKYKMDYYIEGLPYIFHIDTYLQTPDGYQYSQVFLDKVRQNKDISNKDIITLQKSSIINTTSITQKSSNSYHNNTVDIMDEIDDIGSFFDD